MDIANKKIFALVDCNNFYASCERIFRPDLEAKPIAVLSNNDGCIIARSAEVKAMGIPMGEPFFKVKHLLSQNRVHIFSSNYELYGDISQRIMNTLTTFAPQTDIYSIDEAFLDLSSLTNVNLEAYAREIQQTVYKEIGVPVSVGIGTSKPLLNWLTAWQKNPPGQRGCSTW